MSKITLTGYESVPLKKPTSEEMAAVNLFVDDPTELNAFRHDVAEWTAKSADNIRIIPDAVQTIFELCSTALENKFIKSVKGFESYSLHSEQPHILARLAVWSPAMMDFIQRGFGARKIREVDFDVVCANGKETSLKEFINSAFWSEIKVRLESEKRPNLDDAIRAIFIRDKKSYNTSSPYEQWRESFDKINSPSATFLSLSTSIFPEQLIVSVSYRDRQNFIDNFSISGKREEYGKVIDSIDISEFIDLRRSDYIYPLTCAIEEFSKRWSRDEFVRSIGLASAKYVLKSEIEYKLLNDIIAADLNDNETSKETPANDTTGESTLSRLAEEMQASSIESRLHVIDEYVVENPGQVISPLIRKIFPELSIFEITERNPPPEAAPLKWSSENRLRINGELESPPAFIERVYAPWLGKGLTRADVRRVDDALVQALYTWLRSGNQLPDNFDLPSKPESNTRDLGGNSELVGASFTEREARRLLQAAYRRRKADGKTER